MVMCDSTSSAQIERKCRNSGIELLKIMAIFLVVISHVTKSLIFKNENMISGDYVIDVSRATTDISSFILLLFYYFGCWGNAIFFVCSAWFLQQSSSYNKKKCFYMIFDIWSVSIIILIVSFIIRHGDIPAKYILKSVFPTTFANNWYLTCYLLFYAMHPFLNIIIQRLDKKSLFRVAFVLFMLYIFMGFIKGGLFFTSHIVIWIAIYFAMAYMKRYMSDAMSSTKKNMFLLLFGLLGYLGIAVVTNYLGLHISFLSDKMMRWVSDCNPFLIAMSIALFNLMRKMTLKSKVVNYVSSLSLLIYIIHDNIILRNYYRPKIWLDIYQNCGYRNIVLWVLAVSVGVFLLGLISSVVYDKSIRPLVKKLSDILCSIIRRIYLMIESSLLNM